MSQNRRMETFGDAPSFVMVTLKFFFYFLVTDMKLFKKLCLSVGQLVRWSVMIELKSWKTRISAPAHPSATGGRVFGLVSDIMMQYDVSLPHSQ